MKILSAFLFLTLAIAAPAAAQSVKVPAAVTVDEPGLVVVRATEFDADDLHWYAVGPGLQSFPPDLVPPKLGAYMGFAMKAGVYKIGVIPAKDVNGKAKIGVPQYVVVTVGKPSPPDPPNPPDPPSPLPNGFRVLIVYESAEKLSSGHAAVIGSKDVRQYLYAKCLKVNGTPEYRIFDKDTPVGHESDVWQAAMKLPRQSLPWLIVGNGKDGYQGPLPATVAETMALLKKFGG